VELLERDLSDGPPDRHKKRFEEQRANRATYVIAWLEDQPVGTLLINWLGSDLAAVRAHVGDIPEAADLEVRTDLRSRGIGGRLLCHGEDLVHARSHERLGLAVAIRNVKARELYEWLGYRDWGHGTYEGDATTRTYMIKDLTPTATETRVLQRRPFTRADVERVVPPNTLFILVNKGEGLDVGGGREYVPFPERNGHWGGYPANDVEAVAELERLRACGARFIVFPPRMRYWLEAYPALAEYLQTKATVRGENARARIFELPQGL
jgi:GNAT superfamily N-acetyltransferase